MDSCHRMEKKMKFAHLRSFSILPKTPLFITGYPRSGTTLMRLIMNANSRIAIPDETSIFHWYFKRPFWQCLLNNRFSGNRLYDKAFGTDITANFDQKPLGFRLNAKKSIDFLFSEYAKKEGKEFWGDKTPLHTQFADHIFELFPNAFMINMVRDPRAVVASSKRYFDKKRGKFDFWITQNVEETTNRWKWEIGLTEKFKEKYADQFELVIYEELVLNPEKVVKQLCEKIGLDFEEGMMAHHKGNYVQKGQVASTDWHQEATKPINPANIDKWKNELTQEEIEQVEKALEGSMKTYGYL